MVMDTSDERRNTTTIKERPDIATAQYVSDLYHSQNVPAGVQSVRLSTTLSAGSDTVSVPGGCTYCRIDVTSGTARIAVDRAIASVAPATLGAGIVQDRDAEPSVMRVRGAESIGVAMLGGTSVILAFW